MKLLYEAAPPAPLHINLIINIVDSNSTKRLRYLNTFFLLFLLIYS